MRPCPKPPEADFIFREVENHLELHGQTLGDISNGLPDIHFLLICLATLNPKHAIFQPSYMPPAKVKKPKPSAVIPLYAKLFEGLPAPTLKQLKKRNLKTQNKLLKLH